MVAVMFLLIELALIVLVIAGMWKVFTKAGQPGWASIIPILNAYFFFKIAGKPGWWLLLMLIPIVNIIIYVIATLELARNFGKGTGFAVGLLLLPAIFYPILGFGSATYGAVRPQ